MTGYLPPFDPPKPDTKADYQCGNCGHWHGHHDSWGCLHCECSDRTLPVVPPVPA